MPRLPFNSIQELDLPLTEMVRGRIGFIHDLFLTFSYQACHSLPDGDRDLVVLVSKKDRTQSLRQIDEYPGRVVLVFVPGDASIRSVYLPDRRGLPPNVVAAFATNNELSDGRAVSVPLGVRINKLRPLQFVRQNYQGAKDGLLYGNFALNEKHYNPRSDASAHIRAQLVDQLKDAPWISWDISDDHRDDPANLIHFYKEIARHKFVLSPEGNGVDCYRTWESLYLGAIPIVMMSTPMSAFTDLPILFTEDYTELSKEYLERRWQEMSTLSFEVERMLSSWYFTRFMEAVSALERPRFICWQVEGSPPDKFIRTLGRSSHSPSELVAETPTPPFTGRLGLMSVESWHIAGGLDLVQVPDGLQVSTRQSGKRLLKIPLETIPGGSFTLTGCVYPGSASRLPITFEVRDRTGELASTELISGTTELRLDFVSRFDRTVFTLTAPNDVSGTAFLKNLSVQANL